MVGPVPGFRTIHYRPGPGIAKHPSDHPVKPSCHVTPSRRTWISRLVGVCAILAGGVGSLFSTFAFLMAVGKPYANSSSDPLGIFLIFILPPGTLFAGFGLLLRQRWARWWMILLMSGLIALGVKGLVAPPHDNPAYAPRPGPAAEEMKKAVFLQSSLCIAVGGLVFLGLISPPVRREFSRGDPDSTHVSAESWRVGHRGRDLMFYEELHDGDWRRIEIDGEMLTGRAHHVIYFACPEVWLQYPDWARHRRDEIMARVKSRFAAPDYEYQESGTIPRTVAPHPNPPATHSKAEGRTLPAFFTLFLLASAAFWFAMEGMKTGETRLPARISGNHRVTRAEKPVLYWTGIGLMGSAGTVCAVGAFWLALAAMRRRS